MTGPSTAEATTNRWSCYAAAVGELRIIDATGRQLADVTSGHRAAGHDYACWDAAEAGPGMYFSNLSDDKRTVTDWLIMAR